MTEPRRILLIQGHPDAGARHLGHALAQAYAEAATAAGHTVRLVTVSVLDFPLLRSQQEWEHGPLPTGLAAAQADIAWAQHVVLFFPLWLGDLPALLKGFLEQVLRPAFAFRRGEGASPFAHKALTGRTARVVVTMGMPAAVYRWIFRAHAVRSLERNILGFVGFAPVRESLVGSAGDLAPPAAARWLQRMARLGAQAG